MKKGDRVKMTEEGLNQGLGGGIGNVKPSTTGVVTSELSGKDVIKVLRNNRKTPERYHVRFWELDKLTREW